MFVTPLLAAQGAIELFKGLTSTQKKKEDPVDALNQSNPNPNYDVKNMSFNDLQALTMKLSHDGKLSDKDTQNFLNQISSLQQASGVSKDTKVDMIQLFQNQIQNINKQATNNDSSAFQHSLDLLNGINARSGANIPQSV
jgi:hypothetical protein